MRPGHAIGGGPIDLPGDGRCHNAEAGTFNHECGKPAVWIGTKANGTRAGYCDWCRHHGREAAPYRDWERVE